MFKTLMERWSELSAREKWMIGGGGSATALILFYLYVWQPVALELKKLAVSVPEKRATLVWLQESATEVKKLKADIAADTKGDIAKLAQESAEKAGVSGLSVKNIGAEKASVEVGGATLDKVMMWVNDLRGHKKIKVESLSITPVAGTETVKITGVLIKTDAVPRNAKPAG